MASPHNDWISSFLGLYETAGLDIRLVWTKGWWWFRGQATVNVRSLSLVAFAFERYIKRRELQITFFESHTPELVRPFRDG